VNYFYLYLAAFAAALLTAAATLPLWRRLCLRAGLVDEPGGRKLHGGPIPLAGGLAVMTGLLVPTALGVIGLWCLRAGVISSAALDAETLRRLTHGLNRRSLELAIIFLGAFGMLIVGVLDDRHELRPAAKFAGQFLIALLVCAAGVRITLFIHNVAINYLITILWILTVINAFNFMDNMNGLCAGLGATGAFYFAAISATAGQYLVALIASLTCGALLGFLPYNFPRARAFLGDAGSHLVGYLLAVLAILPHFYTHDQPRALAVLTPLLILAVPLGDLVWVVVLRWSRGKPFYVGDTNHLSHRLVDRGHSRTRAVLLIWLLEIALGGIALFFFNW
jgi:UDP-GlcNAc:undecaprenyl-phosphate GlcNAc-1-phosphate transferase